MEEGKNNLVATFISKQGGGENTLVIWSPEEGRKLKYNIPDLEGFFIDKDHALAVIRRRKPNFSIPSDLEFIVEDQGNFTTSGDVSSFYPYRDPNTNEKGVLLSGNFGLSYVYWDQREGIFKPTKILNEGEEISGGRLSKVSKVIDLCRYNSKSKICALVLTEDDNLKEREYKILKIAFDPQNPKERELETILSIPYNSIDPKKIGLIGTKEESLQYLVLDASGNLYSFEHKPEGDQEPLILEVNVLDIYTKYGNNGNTYLLSREGNGLKLSVIRKKEGKIWKNEIVSFGEDLEKVSGLQVYTTGINISELISKIKKLPYSAQVIDLE